VRSLTRAAFGLFLSAGGIFVLAALESTIFFFFPFGVDAAVIILTVRHPDSRWLYPLLATAGSIAGTLITFWMGKKIGEVGLEKYVPERRLASTKAAIGKRGAVTALFALIPPPFPFTALVLAAGALGVEPIRFFAVFTVVRLLRFGLETAVAARYGSSVLRWINSDVVQDVVVGFIVLAIAASVVSLFALVRKRKPERSLRPNEEY
jgi:membrane protein YqaA with SNARE-associated domain